MPDVRPVRPKNLPPLERSEEWVRERDLRASIRAENPDLGWRGVERKVVEVITEGMPPGAPMTALPPNLRRSDSARMAFPDVAGRRGVSFPPGVRRIDLPWCGPPAWRAVSPKAVGHAFIEYVDDPTGKLTGTFCGMWWLYRKRSQDFIDTNDRGRRPCWLCVSAMLDAQMSLCLLHHHKTGETSIPWGDQLLDDAVNHEDRLVAWLARVAWLFEDARSFHGLGDPTLVQLGRRPGLWRVFERGVRGRTRCAACNYETRPVGNDTRWVACTSCRCLMDMELRTAYVPVVETER